jgi:hypothetical protein
MIYKAYILAADPYFIEASVGSYYAFVDEILVSYDRNGVGHSGQSIPVEECLSRIKEMDTEGKIRFFGGDYCRLDQTPMWNETHQRQSAIDEIGYSADWIIQIDTDEVLTDAKLFFDNLMQVPEERIMVEWPMRSFFRQVGKDRFLEVVTYLRHQLSEYPGPVATRPGVTLTCARCAPSMPMWRFGISRKVHDPVRNGSYAVDAVINKDAAILHFSWVRSEEDIRKKVRGWSHSGDFDGASYIDNIWLPSRTRWPFIYNFHPLEPRRWKALRPVRIQLPGDAGFNNENKV